MLFTIDKNKSLALLQAAMALFILLAPSVIDMLPMHSGVYITFLFSALLFLMRMKKTERVYFSAMNFVMLGLLAYSLISSIWANNREGHLTYLFAEAAVCMFFSVVIDYFKESNTENVRRRMMYLLLSGGVLCTVINIAYWLLYIIPVAGKKAFSQGLGNNDFLAVFVLICIVCAMCLLGSNTLSRKRILLLSILPMLFVFIMAKSLIGWVMGLLICVIFVSSRQSEKMFLPLSVISVAVFTGIVIAVSTVMPWGTAFGDLFSYGLIRPFGSGGGVMSAQALFAAAAYPKGSAAGLMPLLFAQSGIVGIVCCIAVIVRVLMHFYKLRTWESLMNIFVTVMVMALPLGANYAVLLLWIGLIAYNEQAASLSFIRLVKTDFLKKAVYAVGAFCVIASVLLLQSLMRMSADMSLEREDYMSAYSVYRAAAAINITDSESCRYAAICLRKGGNIQLQRDEAIALVDKAIKRDSDNLENIAEKARIYYACEEYDLCAQQYRIASQRAVSSDKYNLSLVKTLYKIVQKNPQGSSETKRAYEEILGIAQKTQNLDYKKEINDIADKALIYTKEELNSEENN